MKNLTIITSVIHTNNSIDYNYCKRSIYSSDERFLQTINTIESIRKYNNSEIVLLEGKPITEKEENNIIDKVDKYINYGNNEIIQKSIDSQFKGLGEAKVMLEFITNNKEYVNQFENIFKISGRYSLNDEFDYSLFDNNKCCFRTHQNIELYTTLYKIHIKHINYYLNFLLYYIATVNETNINNGLEGEIFRFFKTNKNSIITDKMLGVEGFVSVNERIYIKQ